MFTIGTLAKSILTTLAYSISSYVDGDRTFHTKKGRWQICQKYDRRQRNWVAHRLKSKGFYSKHFVNSLQDCTKYGSGNAELSSYSDTVVHVMGTARLPLKFKFVELNQLPFQVDKTKNMLRMIHPFEALGFGIFKSD